MQSLLLGLIAFCLVWPVEWQVGLLTSKRIDLVASDALFILVPLAWWWSPRRPKTGLYQESRFELTVPPQRSTRLLLVISASFVCYSMMVSGLATIWTGETVRIFSAIKLIKPLCLLGVGLLLSKRFDSNGVLFQWIAVMFGGIVVLTTHSMAQQPGFPVDRWGQTILGMPLYGHPNSPMSFYAVMVPLLLAYGEKLQTSRGRIAVMTIVGCVVVMVVGSGSRASLVSLILGTSAYWLMTRRWLPLAALGTFLMVLVRWGTTLLPSIAGLNSGNLLLAKLIIRINRTTGSQDPSSGRFDIWSSTLNHCWERPWFGYQFEPFSKYFGQYETPHQQYLEVLYKCGLLGLMMYLAILGMCLWLLWKAMPAQSGHQPERLQKCAIFSMFLGVLAGNFTQPNLSYSITGNTTLFLVGWAISRATIPDGEHDGRNTLQTTTSIAKPVLRLPRIRRPQHELRPISCRTE